MAYDGPVLQSYFYWTTNIDLMTIGDTLVFTTEPGLGLFFVTQWFMYVSLNSGLATGPTVSLGYTGPGYADVQTNILTNVPATAKYRELNLTSSDPGTIPASSAVYFRISTAAGGPGSPAGTCQILVIGRYRG